ncbi:hypothetical protein [Nafulsella turpanensis]|uniref:hypothetical protein n=1 Tax=Nafulsella turpanensis TaxID=1265690 RepID=UPI00034C0E00|nr:hypothetical protein [Nafulsella turpanensis]
MLLLVFFICTSLAAQEQPLKLNANVIEHPCSGEGHVISLKAEGGKEPYSYRWKDGTSGGFREGLTSGTYECVVEDAQGKSISRVFNFAAQPAPLVLKYTQEKAAENLASLSLQVTGGKVPYTYYWFGPGLDTEAMRNTSSHSGLPAGTFHIIVKDASECSENITVTIK